MKIHEKRVIVTKEGKISLVDRDYNIDKENILKYWDITLKNEVDLFNIYLELRYDNVLKFKDEKHQKNYKEGCLKLFKKSKKVKEARIKEYKKCKNKGIHKNFYN